MNEQIFFADPMHDRLMGVVLSLAAEVYIQRDRAGALEELLIANGVLTAGALEAWQGDVAARAAGRDAFINSVLEPLLAGTQAASRVDEAYARSLM